MVSVNAHLTKIEDDNPTVDAYGVPTAGTATVLWTGEAGG